MEQIPNPGRCWHWSDPKKEVGTSKVPSGRRPPFQRLGKAPGQAGIYGAAQEEDEIPVWHTEMAEKTSQSRFGMAKIPTQSQFGIPQNPSQSQSGVAKIPSQSQFGVAQTSSQSQFGMAKIPTQSQFGIPQNPSQSQVGTWGWHKSHPRKTQKRGKLGKK